MQLSEAQRLAVETVGKNVCVSAAAGSGKTRVLVERFLHLVTQHQILPTEILAITFTEKAANEMKRRIVGRLREEKLEEARREVESAAIGTIHSFSARLLREHPVEAGVDPHFVIYEAEQAALLKERVLDEVIETQVSGPEVFNLLRLYGEDSVREGILEAYQRSRNSERPFEEILRQRTAGTREFFESELRRGLQAILDVNGAGEVLKELEFLFRKKELGQAERGRLSLLRGKLRAAGKQKDEIQRVKDTLTDFANFLREEISLPVREVFIRLALQFERAYEEAKQTERALDFDDLQLQAVKLLGSDRPASRLIRRLYREKFREILVDEFQDTNRLQDRLLELIRRESNLFIVGDLKQSIYAFRGTQVEIFLEKEKSFSESPGGRRISLAENYRARPSLIDFVNRFFEVLWKEDSIPFEPLQAIRTEEGAGPRVERLRLEKSEEEDLEALRIREARTLAHEIQALVKNEGFHYQDIACLFEAMTQVHFYEQELRRAGIPYFVVSNRGFYSQPEIRDVLSFLSVLENPKRDVPLAALLRSPLFQISDETLFWLARRAKKEKREAPLAEGVRAFEAVSEISGLEKERLRFFAETCKLFLTEKEKLRISELIEQILRRTGYDLYVLKLRQGERRYANLKKLVEIAREMESKEPIHLGDFVRAVKGLETREVRESQAQVEAEEGDVVRLMTIHMAKGLEFPVVILPDLGRGERQEGGNFSVSEEEGLGIKVRNERTFKFEDTLTLSRIRKRRERSRSEESKRLFYVAMTRAQEKLILSGPAPSNKKEPKHSFHEMSTWAEWVDRILSEGNWNVKFLEETPPQPFPYEKRKALAERKSIRSRLESLSPVRLREVPPGVDSILANLVSVPRASFPRIDLPVSAFLLFARDPEEYFRVYEIGVPQNFPLGKSFEVKEEEAKIEEGLTSAEFGTLVHQILEQLLLRKASPARATSMVERFTQGTSPAEKKEILDLTLQFVRSEEAREIFKAKAFYPELPFALRLPHGLIEGKMDLIYQNQKGEWVILDYKTSQVDARNFAARGEEYRIQMELYALAVQQILGSPPTEARLHFLRPSLTHTLTFGPADFQLLYQKFTGLQRGILEFRQSRLGPCAAPSLGGKI